MNGADAKQKIVAKDNISLTETRKKVKNYTDFYFLQKDSDTQVVPKENEPATNLCEVLSPKEQLHLVTQIPTVEDKPQQEDFIVVVELNGQMVALLRNIQEDTALNVVRTEIEKKFNQQKFLFNINGNTIPQEKEIGILLKHALQGTKILLEPLVEEEEVKAPQTKFDQNSQVNPAQQEEEKSSFSQLQQQQEVTEQIDTTQPVTISPQEVKPQELLQLQQPVQEQIPDKEPDAQLYNPESFIPNHDLPISTPVMNLQRSDPDELMIGSDMVQDFPQCAERTLKLLIADVKRMEQRLIQIRSEDLVQTLTKLEIQLMEEGLLKPSIHDLLEKAKPLASILDVKELIKPLNKIFKAIVTLDISRLRILLEKARQASIRIRDKNVILFIGQSGAGKSTTIHFLAGSKMVKTHIGNIKHIGPAEITNSQAADIMTGPFAFSVTKFIYCVDVGDLVLTDTPGFEDSQGPEVDIANGYGVVEGIRQCKSIIPAIVVSSKGMGDRCEGIKKLTKLIVTMFSNIEDIKDSFQYILTKYETEENKEDCVALLNHVVDTLTDEEKQDQAFTLLVDDLAFKATEKNVFFLDPLADNPRNILRKLKGSQKISDPQSCVRQYITKSSEDVLKIQVQYHKRAIEEALRRNRIDLVIHKLKELKFVDETLNKSFTQEALEDSIKNIKEYLNDRADILKNNLKRCFDKENSLKEEDLHNFADGISQFRNCDSLKEVIEEGGFEGTDSLKAFLVQLMKSTAESVKQLPYKDKYTKVILDKLKMTSENFMFLQMQYLEVRQAIFNSIVGDLNEFPYLYKENMYQESANLMSTLKKAVDNLKQNHLGDTDIEDEINKAVSLFLEYLDSLQKSISQRIKQLIVALNGVTIIQSDSEVYLEEDDDLLGQVEKIGQIFNQLEAFCVFKNSDINDKVIEIKKTSQDVILDFIDKLIVSIQEQTQDKISDKFFQDIEVRFKVLNATIKANSIIENKALIKYSDLKDQLSRLVQNKVRETQDLLQSLQGDNSEEKFKIIQENLKIIKSSAWLEEFIKGTCSTAVSDFFTKILHHAKQLLDTSKSIVITLEDYESINQIPKLVHELENLRIFDSLNEDPDIQIEPIVAKAREHFKDQFVTIQDNLKLILQEIPEALNLDINQRLLGIGISKYEDILQSLKKFASLKFQNCESLKIEKDKIAEIHGTFNSEMINFKKTCENYVKKLFEAICEYDGNNKQFVSQCTSNLEEILAILTQMKDKLPICESLIDPDTILKKTDAMFNDYQIELLENIKSKIASNRPFDSDLQILRFLRNLDRFKTGEKFLENFKEYSNKNNNQQVDNLTESNQKIRDLNFYGVYDDITLLDQRKDNAAAEIQKKQLIKQVQRTLTDLIDVTLRYALQTQSKMGMTAEKIMDIMKNVRKIKEAINLQDYLPATPEMDLKKSIELIINTLQQNYLARLQEIKDHLQVNNFFKVNEEMQEMIHLRGLMDDQFFQSKQEINEKHEEIKKFIDQKIGEIVDFYRNNEIAKYASKPVKPIIDKLQRGQQEGAIQQIEEVVTQKFIEEIAKIKETSQDQKAELALKHLTYYLNPMSENIRLNIEFMITNAREEVRSEMEQREHDIKQAKEARNIPNLESILNKSKASGNFKDVEQIKDILDEYIEDHSKYVIKQGLALPEKSVNALLEIYKIKTMITRNFESTVNFIKLENVHRQIRHAFRESINKMTTYLTYQDDLDMEDGDSLDFDASTEYEFNMNGTPVNRNEDKNSHRYILDYLKFRDQHPTECLSFIPDFDVIIHMQLTRIYVDLSKNDMTIITKLTEEYPDLCEIHKNLNFIKQKSDYLRQIKIHVSALGAAVEEEPKNMIVQEKIEDGEEKVSVNAQYKMIFEKLDMVLLFPKIKERIIQKFTPILEKTREMSYDLINDQTKQQGVDREEFYKKLNFLMKFVSKQVSVQYLFVKHGTPELEFQRVVDESKAQLNVNIRRIYEVIQKRIKEKKFDVEACNELRVYYSNFNDFWNLVDPDFRVSELKIEEVREKISNEVRGLYDSCTSAKNVAPQAIVEKLIALKNVEKVHVDFRSQCIKNIDQTLVFINKHKDKTKLMSVIQDKLKSDPIGNEIIEDHAAFKTYGISIFNSKTQTQDIDYVLRNIEGGTDYKAFYGPEKAWKDNVDKDYLRKQYDRFKQIYEELVKKYIFGDIQAGLDDIKAYININFKEAEQKQLEDWSGIFKIKITELMAYIFAIWTLMNSEYYKQEKEDKKDIDEEEKKKQEDLIEHGMQGAAGLQLMKPHPAQIVSILRLIGLGNKLPKGFLNNLVQIGTGEGKSVTIAVTAMILAIFGFDVSCACYSQYLSKRDKAAFQNMFSFLGVEEYITYGTFNELCEKVINKRVNIRSAVNNYFVHGSANNEIRLSSKRLQALIIDEVDVFFSKEFYGMQYGPQTEIRDETISEVLKFIWDNRKKDKFVRKDVQSSAQYQKMVAKFPSWKEVLDESVLDMIDGAKKYSTQTYEFDEVAQQIGYKVQDRVDFNLSYGYKTLYAYFELYEQGKISQEKLNQNLCLSLNSGYFSYAEMPKDFQIIMGVTGTLRTVSKEQKYIIEKEFKLKQMTFMPSVFGPNQLNFDEKNDVKISSTEFFYNDICNEVSLQLSQLRPVLLFFENEEKLKLFFNSPSFAVLKAQYNPYTLTEKARSDEKDIVIKQATQINKLTLFTKSYGRGTDFITRDERVQSNGGSFVIQTFFSDDVSEETQIKGRTARQGERGFYRMILHLKDLEKVAVTEEVLKEQGKAIYDFMNNVRARNFSNFFKTHMDNAKKAIRDHNESKNFQKAILDQNIGLIRKYILEWNRGQAELNPAKLMVLMDATGSMGSLIERAKQTVVTMFEQAHELLKKEGLPVDCFLVSFAAFRNYGDSEADLLQYSSWTSKPLELKQFLNGVPASGGYGANEAVEVGLWHAVQEHKKEPINSVILIGDACPNTAKEFIDKRNATKTHLTSKYRVVRYYEDELNELIKDGVPVNAYYVTMYPKQSFEGIAAKSKGESQFLNISSSEGAEQLTFLVTKQIISAIDKNSGKGGKLLSEYILRYKPPSMA